MKFCGSVGCSRWKCFVATVPAAHVYVRFHANDLSRSDPSNLVTRLERHLHRHPDTIADLQRIPGYLKKRGYTEADIEGIMHGNWLRFFRDAWTKKK